MKAVCDSPSSDGAYMCMKYRQIILSGSKVMARKSVESFSSYSEDKVDESDARLGHYINVRY
jgi:hypothetical protein